MRRFPAGAAQHQGEALPRIDIIDDITGTIGRRPSGARLYHRGSRFGEPERRKLDRNLVARILYLAEALERRTRTKGQHGGLLKGKGLDVLRALLRSFYSYRTGECFPSHEANRPCPRLLLELFLGIAVLLMKNHSSGWITVLRRHTGVDNSGQDGGNSHDNTSL